MTEISSVFRVDYKNRENTIMYGFKYDYLNNRSWKSKDGYAYEILKEQAFFVPHEGQKFILDLTQPNHWVNFTVYDRVIRVFYRRVSRVNGSEIITCYQKDIPRAEIIEFELMENDVVMKRDDKLSREKMKKLK